MGQAQDPWGTPEVTSQAGDLAPSMTACWERPWRNEFSQLSKFPLIL